MVRNTTLQALSNILDAGKNSVLLIILLVFGYSNILEARIHTSSSYCPDVNLPTVNIFNSNDEIIEEACIADTIYIEIILEDLDEEINSFLFYQDINSNNIFDPGEECDVESFEINDHIGVFRITTNNPGQIYFSIIISGCSEYEQVVNNFEFLNCEMNLDQACFCIDNATIDTPGEFLDAYSYIAYAGDVLIVVDNNDAINPDNQNLYPIGFEFLTDVDGIIEFWIQHSDVSGYELKLENGNGQRYILSNTCFYPVPQTNIADTYCTNHEDIIIEVTAHGLTGTYEVLLDGNPIDVLSPSTMFQGVYTVEFSFTADPTSIPSLSGCTTYRSFDLEIFGDSPPSLVCNSFLNLGLSSAGFFVLTPDVLISDGGTIGCYSSFDLLIFGQDHDTIFCSDIGNQIFAMVTDPSTNSSCFSTITVHDKLGPIISGQDTVIVNCNVDESDPVLLESIEVTDNCSSEVDLIYEDYHFNFFFCDADNPQLVKQFIRRYTATDNYGNQSIFEQLIQFVRPGVDEIEFPQDTLLPCDIDDVLLNPENLGEPSFDEVTISLMNCIYQVTYSDVELPAGCSGRNNIRRTWSILDPCTAITTTHQQFINFIDEEKPVIICPDTMQFEVPQGSCEFNFTLHEPEVTDNCTDNLLVFTLYNNSIVFSDQIVLNVGTHSFTIYANDLCGNLDSCSYIVNILDSEFPMVECSPITVELDEFGEVFVGLEGLDLNISENCGILDTLVRRANHQDFGTELYFTCYDVLDPVEIIVQVTDINGNITEISCFVSVEDNIDPIIDCGTAFSPIDCNDIPYNLNDLFPIPDFSDNCIIAFTENDIVANLNECFEGTLVRMFSATDISGNSTGCEQTIIVENNTVLTEDDIDWPAVEILLEECQPNTDILVTGSPIFDATNFCAGIEVSFTDNESFDNLNNCIVIERTWEILDVCQFDNSGGTSGLFNFVQTITTRPLDYDLIVPGDVIVDADSNCEAFVELSGAVAFNCVQDITISNDYDPIQGGQVSAIFPLGVTVIEFTSEDGCGVVKTETVSVTVEDNTNPEITHCPEDVTIECNDDISDLSIYGEIEATDNCGIADIEEEVVFDLTDCGSGTITRTWTVTDSSGNSSTCEQIITINGPEPLTLADITWPEEELLLETCIPNIDSSIIGTPNIVAGFCAEIEVSFSDNESFDNLNNCIVIERTWEVLDVCQFDNSGGTSGLFNFVQTIATRPLDYDLIVSADVIVNADSNCEAFVELPGAAAFNCVQDITISNDYDPIQGAQVSAIFPLGVTVIEFTSEDGCGIIKTETVTITVEDNTNPEITFCPEDVTIECNDDISDLSIYGEIEAIDNCGIADIEEEVVFDLTYCGSGTITRTWIVTDDSGNTNICEQIITINGPEPLTGGDITWPEDVEVEGCMPNNDPGVLGEPSFASEECRDLEISYEDTEEEDVEGCFFIERNWTVIDNCDIYLPGENVFTHTQIIYNNDIRDFELVINPFFNSEIEPGLCEAYFDIELEVVGQCESLVEVVWDLIFPNGDQVNGTGLDLSGFYPVGPTTINFSVQSECFGIKSVAVEILVEDNEAPMITVVPGDITISCTNMSFDITGGFEAFDVCGIDTTFIVIDTLSIDECGLGIYEVIFTAIDVNGNSSSDSRLVEYFSNMNGITENDFNVLQDTIEIECGMDPVDTGVLVYTGSNGCFPIEISYSDEVDNTQPGFCAVITRIWTAFSPCDDDDNTVMITQIIRIVEDNSAPDLSEIQDTTYYLISTSCEAEVIFNENLIDECLLFSITNDSPFAYSGNGLPDGSYPPGNYVVEIVAEDYCGNVSIKSIVISVIDTIAPNVGCQTDLQFSLNLDGEIEINVNELANLLAPNCSDNYLTFSPIGDSNDTNILFDCLGLGIQEITIYAFDESGNSSSCTQQIEIIDLELACGGVGGRISGSIRTIYGEEVGNVDLEVKSSEFLLGNKNITGNYSFDVLLYRDYSIAADKIDEMNNGVTILDLILLAQHIVENRPMENPYLLIAADVNDDRKINFKDLVEMRNVMMRRLDQFSGGKSWRFIPQDWEFADNANILGMDIPETIEIMNLEGDLTDQNFIGIKIGDINSTAVSIRSVNTWAYESFEKAGLTTVRIYPNDSERWLGLDLNLYLPAGAKIVNSVWSGIQENNNLVVDENMMENSIYKIIGFSTQPLNNLNSNVYLEFDVSNLPIDFDLDNLFREISIGVNKSNQVYVLKFSKLVSVEMNQSRVYPNPFKHTALIEAEMNRAEEGAEFTIVDKTGRIIHQRSINLSAGINTLEVNSNMINVPGVYYYKIKLSSGILQGQIIKID